MQQFVALLTVNPVLYSYTRKVTFRIELELTSM